MPADPTNPADPPNPRTARHLHMLQELADIGMDLARLIHRQALAADAASNAPQTADAFARVSRAIRQTLALEARFADPPRPAPGPAARRRQRHRRDELRHLVERSIETDPDVRDTDALLLELDERLDDPDIDAALADRPAADIAFAICRALGVTADLSQWPDEVIGLAPAPQPPPRSGPSGLDPPECELATIPP